MNIASDGGWLRGGVPILDPDLLDADFSVADLTLPLRVDSTGYADSYKPEQIWRRWLGSPIGPKASKAPKPPKPPKPPKATRPPRIPEPRWLVEIDSVLGSLSPFERKVLKAQARREWEASVAQRLAQRLSKANRSI
jgi:hypothetical protein